MSVAEVARAAAQHILAELRKQGKRPKDLPDAIERGMLTDLEWCEVLEDFRERHRPPPPALTLLTSEERGQRVREGLARRRQGAA